MPWLPYQPNPDNITTGDCTVRAVCAVTGLDWKTAHTALCELAREMSDMPSTNRVWWAFLRAIGFGQFHLLDRCPDCFTVRDFAEANPHGVYVLGPHEHAVAVINGAWWDSWDSGNTVPMYYFVKEENKDGMESVQHAGISESGVSGGVSAVESAADVPAAATAESVAEQDGGGAAG